MLRLQPRVYGIYHAGEDEIRREESGSVLEGPNYAACSECSDDYSNSSGELDSERDDERQPRSEYQQRKQAAVERRSYASPRPERRVSELSGCSEQEVVHIDVENY